MTTLNTLSDLFVNELKDIYGAEKQIVKALPKMVKATTSGALSSALEEHHAATEEHVRRLEKVFELIDQPAEAKACPGMGGIIKEGSSLIKEKPAPSVMDAGLIGAAQRVEHYEIAAYGTLANYARQLGLDEVAQILEETLSEEKEADERLSEIAATINAEAVTSDDGDPLSQED